MTEHIDVLQEVFKSARQRRPFTIEGIVILPDHLHCIWTLPAGEADFSTRWHDIKARFVAQIPEGERLSEPDARRKGSVAFGSDAYGNTLFVMSETYERHVDYIHYNPVKHGYVTRVADWPYSRFHRHVRHGINNHENVVDADVWFLEME